MREREIRSESLRWAKLLLNLIAKELDVFLEAD
jgi:hypothetical protein